ncbi:hypothetical protein F5Y19DRAFT_468724 [Xylariaceae sp. FL1651]|nr:hypothetical protein F5Y19DRAFT_468724 [Xylariaceae sp. FL1651]
MAEDEPDVDYQSIADAATASWYAHRASTPRSKRSSSARHETRQTQTQTPAPAPASAPSPAPTSSEGSSSEARGSGDPSVHSDITAWQSALQSLPAEFSNAPQPVHPLAQALAEQPTLRPVEWNQYRQQGGFVPRTPHDYSSLMIYISGQVNPNPCRNCLLRNGPFARCVVSPPAVLANSTLRHACANCTYQNQYKKCTNDPISEHERARSEMARPVMRAKNPLPRPTIPRKPKTNSRTKLLHRHQQRQQEQLQQLQQPQQQQPQEDLSITQSPAGQGVTSESFYEKLRHVRAWSPRSRRRMTAEALQWQAAIATIEAEEAASAPEASVPGRSSHGASSYTRLQVPLSSYTPSQPISTSSATFATPLFARRSPVERGNPNYGTEHAYEPMDEDESESEQEDGREDTSWAGPNQPRPMIKAPR